MSSKQSGSEITKPKRNRSKTNRAPISRSENMSRIRAKNTQPELKVRRALWAAGLRYRLHDKRLPGNPDIVFPGRRTVVFIHGCFWHGHEGCSNFRTPKTRTEWWTEKLERNKARDDQVTSELKTRGWRVLVIWECEVDDPARLAALVERVKSQDVKRGYLPQPTATRD